MSNNNLPVADLASILTEYAQIQRAVRNHDKATNAEEIRDILYQEHAVEL